MEIDFLPIASQELIDTSKYYELQAEGLGTNFLEQIESSLKSIKENPKAWTKISTNVRRCLTKRFPYCLLYVIEKNMILIIAVMPLRRKPKYWSHRLEGL